MTEPLTETEIEDWRRKFEPLDDAQHALNPTTGRRLLATIDKLREERDDLTEECEALSRMNREQDEGLAKYEARIAALEKVVEKAQEDLADAKANCGGDGEGCEVFRPYFDNAATRHRKCSQCPMEAISETAAALAALDSTVTPSVNDIEAKAVDLDAPEPDKLPPGYHADAPTLWLFHQTLKSIAEADHDDARTLRAIAADALAQAWRPNDPTEDHP